jgi:hypothetical protein
LCEQPASPANSIAKRRSFLTVMVVADVITDVPAIVTNSALGIIDPSTGG